MEKRYLLYIDILGFSDLVKKDYTKIERLFNIIDSLNAQKHPNFKTVVFSDTILIFNQDNPETNYDHYYLVMYCCEFAQDLLYRCFDQDIQFRAILTYDYFQYKQLNNIEAYFGNALVNTYNKEKEITGLWLYIDKRINKYNKYFASDTFDDDLNFVFLLKSMERLKKYGVTDFPIDKYFAEPETEFMGLKIEFKILQTVWENIKTQTDSRVRSKYLQTYELYRNRYKDFFLEIEHNNFDINIVSPNANWDETGMIW